MHLIPRSLTFSFGLSSIRAYEHPPKRNEAYWQRFQRRDCFWWNPLHNCWHEADNWSPAKFTSAMVGDNPVLQFCEFWSSRKYIAEVTLKKRQYLFFSLSDLPIILEYYCGLVDLGLYVWPTSKFSLFKRLSPSLSQYRHNSYRTLSQVILSWRCPLPKWFK